jgi:hypothetical protein
MEHLIISHAGLHSEIGKNSQTASQMSHSYQEESELLRR